MVIFHSYGSLPGRVLFVKFNSYYNGIVPDRFMESRSSHEATKKMMDMFFLIPLASWKNMENRQISSGNLT